jgi:hypothetical protein
MGSVPPLVRTFWL